MCAVGVPVIRVAMSRRGDWRVALADTTMTCDTLDDARRVAYLAATRCRPCELIVHDAYHHVILDERLPASCES